MKTNTRVVDKDKEVRQDHELHGRGNDVIPSVVLNLSHLLYVAFKGKFSNYLWIKRFVCVFLRRTQ